jgi:hypothetical protein
VNGVEVESPPNNRSSVNGTPRVSTLRAECAMASREA